MQQTRARCVHMYIQFEAPNANNYEQSDGVNGGSDDKSSSPLI